MFGLDGWDSSMNCSGTHFCMSTSSHDRTAWAGTDIVTYNCTGVIMVDGAFGVCERHVQKYRSRSSWES